VLGARTGRAYLFKVSIHDVAYARECLYANGLGASAIDREYGCLAYQKQRVFSQMPAETSSFTGEKQLISFVLKLLNRDFSPGVGSQMCVELIVLLHTGFAGRACRDTGTEFLKVYTYPVEGETASAVGTFNSRQCWA